jgi:GT2 family glycosyltransferase
VSERSAGADDGGGGGAPLVSVIVPAFNAAATIEETLFSALGQSLRDIEVIVVDDGSTDATPQIAARLAAADPRLRLVRQENRGVSAARNAALALARGRFVAPLDADDLWHPRKLEKQVAAALAPGPAPGFVYCFFRGIDGSGHVLAPSEALALEGSIYFRHVYKNVVGTGSGALFLRAAVLEAGGYEESLSWAEDYMLQLRIARRRPVGVVPEYLVGYRVGAGSLSADDDAVHRQRRRALAAIEEEFGPLPAALLRWSRGRAAGDLAGKRLRARRPLAAAAALLDAIRYDPLRTALRVVERCSRSGVGAEPARHFSQLDSREPPPASAARTGWAAGTLRALDARRLRRLAMLDEAL